MLPNLWRKWGGSDRGQNTHLAYMLSRRDACDRHEHSQRPHVKAR